MAEERFTGVVQWFNNIKGFGFIKPDDGGEDLFVHQSSIRSDGYRTLLEGDRVEFCIATGDNDKTKAVDVTGLHGAPLQPRAAAGNRGPAGYGFGARRNGSGAACYQEAAAAERAVVGVVFGAGRLGIWLGIAALKEGGSVVVAVVVTVVVVVAVEIARALIVGSLGILRENALKLLGD
uniref:Glycine-rich protein 2 n=1 Tax=Cajanus cajan TaxID=3821 RepID=A0A151TID0_CAJCA|nr:Glycine-rich protein 2 [Cajanus cajan]